MVSGFFANVLGIISQAFHGTGPGSRPIQMMEKIPGQLEDVVIAAVSVLQSTEYSTSTDATQVGF